MPLELTKYISTSSALKIWTIITHGLIFCGSAHAIFPILLIEVFGMDPDSYFSPIAYLTLFGQLLLILSIFSKAPASKIIIHMCGLLLLWSAIMYFAWYARNHPHFILSILSLIPFAVCTIITVAGKIIKRLYYRFLGKQ